MVWIKNRTSAANNVLQDSATGYNQLRSNTTDAQISLGGAFGATSSGFSTTLTGLAYNQSAENYVSWTFRKQPKFFDVVTYTGDGATPRVISHSLGSTPGCIIVKNTSSSQGWFVYHRSLNGGTTPEQWQLILNTTAAATGSSTVWGSVAPTSTGFNVGSVLNTNGTTYVAYLFAHNAGGFGLTGTDNVISCGSVVADAYVNLGWEPQWILIKSATDAGQEWEIVDNMRGMNAIGSSAIISQGLQPNSSAAEANAGLTGSAPQIDATGFKNNSSSVIPGSTYIYIAIRRGPMKTPTNGITVFSPVATTGSTSSNIFFIGGYYPDLIISKARTNTATSAITDRLRGIATSNSGSFPVIRAESTAAETSSTSLAYQTVLLSYIQDVVAGAGDGGVGYFFNRAPGFFDVVCYTGTGAVNTINHNLGVAPEFMVSKSRSNGSTFWRVYCSAFASPSDTYLNMNVNTSALSLSGYWPSVTSTTFQLAAPYDYNSSGWTYAAYLFASCPGVSKVGSYTGTGALQTINCGFTGGARFVLIKRTDSTGDWYVYDSARGISSGNDPYLLLNSTAAEVTGTNYVDTTSVGFQVTAAAPAGLNANGGTYIFLAIA